MNWKGICIHHSATTDSGTSSWEAIRRYHTETNGWSDIGYHFGIEFVGVQPVIRIGRPADKSGAHAVGLNSTHIGICVVGNFDEVAPDPRTIEMLRVLIADLAVTYGFEVNEQTIKYHNEVAPKTCPGLKFPSKQALLLK